MDYYQLDGLGFVLYKTDGDRVWYFDPGKGVWMGSYMTPTEILDRELRKPPSAKKLSKKETATTLGHLVNRRV